MTAKDPLTSAIRSTQQRFGELRKSAAAPALDDAQREARLLELKARIAGRTLYTIGHSTMGFSEFLALIRPESAPPDIDMVIDVRSKPFSRRAPWAKRDDLLADLPPLGVAYVWLGHLLGGLPPDAKFYGPGHKVDYPRLSRSRAYQSGLYELLKFIAWGRRAVIMCSEEDPATCHRKLLVAQSLHDLALGLKIVHIRRNHPSPAS